MWSDSKVWQHIGVIVSSLGVGPQLNIKLTSYVSIRTHPPSSNSISHKVGTNTLSLTLPRGTRSSRHLRNFVICTSWVEHAAKT